MDWQLSAKWRDSMFGDMGKQMFLQVALFTTRFIHLYRWTGNSTVTTKYTTVAFIWFQSGFTVCTFIKKLTGIYGH